MTVAESHVRATGCVAGPQYCLAKHCQPRLIGYGVPACCTLTVLTPTVAVAMLHAAKVITVPAPRADTAPKTWTLYRQPLNHTAAQAFCAATGDSLVSIQTQAQHESLYQAFAGAASRVIIGLVAKPGVGPTTNKTEWNWISTGQTPEYDGWGVAEPNNLGGVEGLCGVASLVEGGYFQDYPCSQEAPFACELSE